MPTSTRKSPSRLRSKSPGRRSTSRSRSRGRSKSRGRSPGRKAKQSPPPKDQAEKTTPKRESRPRTKTPSTPTRQSARVAAIATAKEESKQKENAESSSVSKRSSQTSLSKKSSSKEEKKTIMQSKAKVEESSKSYGKNIGAFMSILCLPLFVLTINLICDKECVITKLPVIPRTLTTYFNLKASVIYLGWIAFHFILAGLPVGRVVEGQPLSNGKRLKYRCNGFFALLVSFLCFGAMIYFDYPVHKLQAMCIPFITTGIIFSFLISLVLFIRSRKLKDDEKSFSGNTGNVLYDFLMGRELNPRILGVDLKFVLTLRPGLIGWALLNVSYIMGAIHQSEGGLPNTALLMVAAFQIWYVVEGLWFEESILSTMNITYEGLGFMSVLGDLVWVPFIYSLQGKFLLHHPQKWSSFSLVTFALLNLIGYVIYRGSNMQKHRFRTNPYDPSLTHLDTLATSSGKRLLVSGWWGLCRHPNYLGDLIMAFTWSLPCGFSHALPWFYPFFSLLLHVSRAQRDHAQCKLKYGSSWDRYCQRVSYRICPYIY